MSYSLDYKKLGGKCTCPPKHLQPPTAIICCDSIHCKHNPLLDGLDVNVIYELHCCEDWNTALCIDTFSRPQHVALRIDGGDMVLDTKRIGVLIRLLSALQRDLDMEDSDD